MKKQEGITLIALVITIIVLLILAGVTIAMLAGDNGILSRATSSRAQSALGDAKDRVSIVLSEALTEFYEEKYVKSNASLTNVAAASAAGTALSGITTDKIGVQGVEVEETSSEYIILKYTADGTSVKGTLDNETLKWTNN